MLEQGPGSEIRSVAWFDTVDKTRGKWPPRPGKTVNVPPGLDIQMVTNIPEAALSGNGQEIVDGDAIPSLADGTDFGWGVQGQAGPSRSFRLRNDGTGPLAVQGVVLPTGFTLLEPLDDVIDPGTEDTFTVQLTAQAIGTYGGMVSIANSDSDENPFDFAITGTMLAQGPEIQVDGKGLDIADGDATSGSRTERIAGASWREGRGR